MLIRYVNLSLTSFKHKIQQKQLTLSKSYASAQHEILINPELSHPCLLDIFQLYLTLRFVRQRRLTLDFI